MINDTRTSRRFTIGIDFGTLSGRAVLIDALSGEELSSSTFAYPHGVMDETLPGGKKLPPLYALQDPDDYLGVLRKTIPDVLQKAGVDADDVAGLGIDFTSCTLLPTDEEWVPLCKKPEFSGEPHAYVKLWKHHAAQYCADEMTALAAARGEEWLAFYGGKISSEFAFPKILQVLRESPAVFDAAAHFVEAGDWITGLLTGEETRSVSFAGYKAAWNEATGYPSDEFLSALDPRLHGIVGTKLSPNVYGVGQIAGRLNGNGAALTGLRVGTPLSLPLIDAHAAMPALGITGGGTMMLIVGTSGVHIINDRVRRPVPGICGCVRDAVIPGYFTYEAGQAAVGDVFDWFVKNCVPASYEKEAAERGIGIHALLREKAKRLEPGQSGLLALDWVGGNRSVLVNAGLSGMVLGMTMQTKPEEIYRAWIEATAFGTRVIIDAYEHNGVAIGEICAAGGIAQKDDMMMQIYADVTGRPIRVAGSTQAAALGSAIYASVAGGLYSDLAAATTALTVPDQKTYQPNADHVRVYNELFAEYLRLHDYFGRGGNDVMARLSEIKRPQ